MMGLRAIIVTQVVRIAGDKFERMDRAGTVGGSHSLEAWLGSMRWLLFDMRADASVMKAARRMENGAHRS
jgi:hypothetical protein